MTRQLLLLLTACALVVTVSLGGGNRKKPAYEEPFKDNQPYDPKAPVARYVEPDWSALNPTVGTTTTLTGFYDYQSNGGSVEQIRVNPANGNIHVTTMISTDSTAGGHNNARRTAYAFSSNGGTSWNNFSNVVVPARRSGFPSIDLLRGANAGSPVIANHNDPTGGVRTLLYVDSPEGSGAFSELNSPPLVQSGTDEPIWPYVAGASDGSIVVAASRNAAGTAFRSRTPDYAAWDPMTQVTEVTQSGGRYPVQANGTGRVGILYNTSNGTAALGNWWLESTNNGQTWSTPTNIFPTRQVTSGTRIDTFNSYVHCDFVYNGNNPLFVFSEYATAADRNDVDIVFWSQATGFKVAVPYDTTKYFLDPLNQRFHGLDLGWPSIGLSGNTIVVAYQGFQADTDRHGWHYSDLWYVTSSNGGNNWTAPVRLTNTKTVDERYPSVSKYNAPGQFNMVWTQKSGASGLYAFPGGQQPPNPDTVRTFQMFLRTSLTGVEENGSELANSFTLSQNYPNPFNPATKIDYSVVRASDVSIKVYNMLGQEVETLVNQHLSPGQYQVTFDAKNLPSGVYVYTMRAGSYHESKKMVFMK